MTKFFITASYFLLSTACGQTTSSNFPNEIKTTKLATQINIPGTKVFIVPPEGFKVSSTLPAIEKGNIGLVQAMDLVGGSFYTNAASFSKEKFEQKGVKVIEYKELKLNGFPAKLVLLQGDPQTKVYNLVFGDSTFCVMMTGTFPSNDPKTGEQIKQALLSIYYDKLKVIDPFANAVFKLDDSKSIFKFAKYGAFNYMYSIGGVKKDAYDNEPFFSALALPIEGESIENIANDMSSVIKKGQIKNISKNKTNGYPSLKREIYGILNGKQALLYQHIVFIDNTAVIMQGIADDNFEKYIQEFEKLSNTVNKR